ncbi:MAG: trypsin-like peptidase domain-containing protein [Actinomycetota bacterium]|nr:trypsin-like peptidase domain-containing protein [Actinomycetota bacterium]
MDNNNADPWEIFRPPANADAEPSPIEPEDVEPVETASAIMAPAVFSPPPVMEQSAGPITPPLFPYVKPQTPPEAEERPQRRPGRRWLQPLLGGLAGAAILAGVFWATGIFDESPEIVAATSAVPNIVEIREVVTPGDGGTSAAVVARKVVPSIVTVDVGADVGGTFDRFASGSGVVLTSDGLIVTNQHVIADAERVQVIFEDGRLYEAEVVGSDVRTDLAVLQIATTGLVPIEIGSSEAAQIGETAIAVGSPLGLDGGPSLTVGVVSAFGRQVRTGPADGDVLFDMLQTDAPITQGSSGGALVDGQGRLLGITSAIGVSSAGAEGIGFAIPIELVTRITDEIIETGSVEHAFLGIGLGVVFEEAPDGAQVPAGVLVDNFPVDPSAAQLAGVQVGDLIVGYDGNPVAVRDDLISGLRRLRVGDTVILEVIRETDQLEIAVVLGVRPEDI